MKSRGNNVKHSLANESQLRNLSQKRSQRVDLICEKLRYGKLWYGDPNTIESAASYAHFNASAQAASITIFDETGEGD